jgi:hypothetical protein
MPLALGYGRITRMAEPRSVPHTPRSDPEWLREDLGKEYYEALGVVSNYDGWLLIVKGWSVTLSLAALGLGFQQRHYAFFGIAAVTGAAFWYLDGLMKGYQYRYYVRMREIEYTAYLINRVRFDSREYGDSEISAPRIDMTWTFKGFPQHEDGTKWDLGKPRRQRVLKKARRGWRRMLGRAGKPDPCHDHPPAKPGPDDYRASEPWRREPWEIYCALRHRFWLTNVMLPHVVAVVIGSLLLIIFASLNLASVHQLRL